MAESKILKENEVEQDQVLTADDILSMDLELVPMTIPQWKKNGKPGVVFFRVMPADEFIKFRKANRQHRDDEDNWVKVFLKCACDAAGNRLFNEQQLVDLKKRSTAVFLEMQDKILALHGIGRQEKTWEALKQILEDAEVDPRVIKLVESKWQSAEDEAKND